MRASSTSKKLASNKGLTMLDLLVVAVIIAIVVNFVVAAMGKAQKSLVLTNAAQQFASYVQQAQSDSKKLHATAAPQMAQVTILNDRYYTVTLDSNGDGVLDPPLVVSLEDRHVRMDGPFPRTVMFDWLGRAFDPTQKMIPSPTVTFAGEGGKTVITFGGAGRPVLTTGNSK
jgi:type II secretory pathway pseudopilin PulG